MVEKDIELIGKVANSLGVSQQDVLNTPFVEIIEMLVVKLDVLKKEMRMNQYQDLTARTAPHHDDLLDEVQHWGFGISGEAGEVADLIKKSVWMGHPWDHQKLAYELGDLLYYIARLSNVIGYSLDEVSVMNQQKLYKRYPNGFNAQDSINRRAEEEERDYKKGKY